MNILQKVEAPQETANEEFVTITSIAFKTGDFVKKGDIIIELETSKATHTIEAETDGYIEYFCSEGDDIAVNEVIVQVYDAFDAHASLPEFCDSDDEDNEDDLDDVVFSKSALDLIEKQHIDKRLFKDFDFVTLDDVKELFEKKI